MRDFKAVWKWVFLVWVGLGLLAVLSLKHAFAAPPTFPTSAPAGRIFRFRLPFESPTLDWTKGDVPIWVIQNSMRGLFRVNADGQVVPDLVEEFKTSNDGKKWVLQLKPGILWSDGVPLRAAQFVDAFKRLLDPDTQSSYSHFLTDLEGADHYKKGKNLGVRELPDHPLSLEITLRHPVAALPGILSHWVTYPVRMDLIGRYKDYGTRPDHMAWLGAYRVTEWMQDLRIIMQTNPQCGKDGQLPKPYFGRVEGWVVLDDATALNLYETGHLELMTDPGQAGLRHADLTHHTSPITYFIGISATHPLTRTPSGILALSAALDRSQIPLVLNASQRAAVSYTPPEIFDLVENSGTEDIHAVSSPELAKMFLKRAGFGNPGLVPPLVLQYFERPMIKTLAEWLQAQWKKNLGIAVELEGQEPRSYWISLHAHAGPLFLNSKGASYPDPDAFFRLFTTHNPQNYGRWKDSEYDGWVNQAAETQATEERNQLYTKASRRLLTQHPGMIPLFFRSTEVLIKPFVRDLVMNPLTGVDFSVAHY